MEDETGEVIGLNGRNPFKLSDAISNMISDACTPQINTEITPKNVFLNQNSKREAMALR